VRYGECNVPDMQDSTENAARDFVHKIEQGLSERRLLDEIGKLSCDELALALVMWHRNQTQASDAAA
jgi:hypothetical protein